MSFCCFVITQLKSYIHSLFIRLYVLPEGIFFSVLEAVNQKYMTSDVDRYVSIAVVRKHNEILPRFACGAPV